MRKDNNMLKTAQLDYDDQLLQDRSKEYIGDDKHRYLLEITETKDVKSHDVVFIGLNPSAADESFSDKTVNYCLELAQENGWKNIVICNLTSYRDPKSGNYDESSWLEKAEENLQHITQAVEKSNNIVIFWGDRAEKINSQYKQRIFNILKKRVIYTIGFTNKNYPLHLAHRKGGKRSINFNHNKKLTERLKFKDSTTP